MKVAQRAPGAGVRKPPRKPREMWRGRASNVMGILSLAVCWRGTLNGCLGSDRGDGEPGRPLARYRQNRRGAAEIERQDGYPGRRKGESGHCRSRSSEAEVQPAILSRANLDHDVSILTTAVDAAGRVRGEAPRWNVSMTIMRPPQHGHGWESGSGLATSAQLVSATSGCAADTSSRRRARAILPAREPLASRP